MNVLVTGGCGFIGSHLAEHIFNKFNMNDIISDLKKILLDFFKVKNCKSRL